MNEISEKIEHFFQPTWSCHPMEPGILDSVDILHISHIILYIYGISSYILWHIILHMAYHLTYGVLSSYTVYQTSNSH